MANLSARESETIAENAPFDGASAQKFAVTPLFALILVVLIGLRGVSLVRAARGGGDGA